MCNLITMHVYFSTTKLLKSVLCSEKLFDYCYVGKYFIDIVLCACRMKFN